MKRLLVYMSLLLTLLFVSCENSEKSSPLNYNNSNEFYSIVNPDNPNNPYDSIGYYHNLALDYIIQNYDEYGCDSADHYNKLKELIVDFETNIHQQIPANQVEDSVNYIFNEFFGEDIYLNSTELAIKYNISMIVQNRVSELISTTKLLDNNYSLQQVIDSLRNLESVWINDLSLTNQDKAILLRTSSVLRFSLVYWDGVINNPLDRWHGSFINCSTSNQDSDELLGTSTTVQNLIAIGLSDAIGAHYGGLFGGITSSAVTGMYLYWDDITDFFEDAWDWVSGWF